MSQLVCLNCKHEVQRTPFGSLLHLNVHDRRKARGSAFCAAKGCKCDVPELEVMSL